MDGLWLLLSVVIQASPLAQAGYTHKITARLQVSHFTFAL